MSAFTALPPYPHRTPVHGRGYRESVGPACPMSVCRYSSRPLGGEPLKPVQFLAITGIPVAAWRNSIAS